MHRWNQPVNKTTQPLLDILHAVYKYQYTLNLFWHMTLVHQRWLLSDCYAVVTISVDLQVATYYERLTERLLTVCGHLQWRNHVRTDVPRRNNNNNLLFTLQRYIFFVLLFLLRVPWSFESSLLWKHWKACLAHILPARRTILFLFSLM